MRKILHIPNFYLPNIGGVEDTCYNIVAELKKDPEYKQEVICFNSRKETVKEVYDGVPIIRVGYFLKKFSQPISINYSKLLREKIKKFNPDIIHLHLPNPLISLYVLLIIPKKTKLVVHYHSDIVNKRLFYFFYKPIEKAVLGRADKIICTTKNYAEGSNKVKNFIDKVSIVQSMINIERITLRKEDSKSLQNLREKYKNTKIILFVGRLVSYKGINYLIEISKLINDNYKILIIGDGPLEKSLKEKAKGDRSIIFLGRVSDQELRVYLHIAYLFTFPSITKNEAYGLALAEALYCGVPAVTFDIPGSGVSWVNQNEVTGLVVEHENLLKFSGAIKRILNDENLREVFSLNAKKWARKNFLVEDVVEKIKKIYKNL